MAKNQVVAGGYYRERIESQVGTGDTSKKAAMENMWLAEVSESGVISMVLLDNNHSLTGYREKVDPKEIGVRFVHASDFKPQVVDRKADQANKVAARAERHLEKNELLSAEFEFGKAISLDQDNVRANFGLGKTYLANGEVEKAKETFKKVVDLDEVVEAENKHIFNELGIELRKQGMFAEAVRHYKRALDLSQKDENLWFNLGRALFEGGQFGQASKALKKALELNPAFEEAKAFFHAAQKRK